jgi:hypothetical protein
LTKVRRKEFLSWVQLIIGASLENNTSPPVKSFDESIASQ